MTIKAIIFDVGGVLMCPRGGSPDKGMFTRAVHSYMAKKFNVTFEQWTACAKGPIAKASKGKITKKQTLNKLSKVLNNPSRKIEKTFKQAYKQGYISNKELKKLAFHLKKKGYKTAILSDQWYVSAEVLIPKSLSKKFNASVVSCYVKTRKPHTKIYKLTLKKLKLKPSDCVFIDDKSYNLVPARKFGMKTILFKNNKQSIKDLKKILK